MLCDPASTTNYALDDWPTFGTGSYDMSDAVGITLDGVLLRSNLHSYEYTKTTETFIRETNTTETRQETQNV